MSNHYSVSTRSTARPALGVFALAMITLGSVDSIRNLPATALFGSQLIFFFVLGAIFFLLPSALVSAELSAAWPKQGGVYVWVKHAFGQQAGFLAIWYQWIENVFWYPTILSFVAATIGFLINPHLAQNKYFIISVVIVAFWGTTFLNLFGMKSSARFSSFCALAGLLIPMALIIGFGASWAVSGQPLQIHFGIHDIFPNVTQPHAWVALEGIMLSFCGMEIATVHAKDVRNPQKSFPKALLISVAILVFTLILGSMALAIVIPEQKISLVAGIMQAFNLFFNHYHAHWILPVVAVMLVIGTIGSVNNWIIAPTKGLLVAGEDGNLPTHCLTENQHGAPKTLLIYQAIIVTVLMLVFILMPSVNGSYWVLTVLAAQLYMMMYILMFITGIVLAFRYPDHHRPFRIPGGKWGMLVVAGAGLIGAIVTLIVGFVPPNNIHIGAAWHYELLIAGGLIIMSLPPIFLHQWYKKRHAIA